jgi:hypothetical protein
MGKHWAEEELSGINLGDERLNKRSVKLLESLADKPSASIPAACHGWAETQAAYRFLAQDGIGWEDILAPHFACTEQRMRAQAIVLCIQDTTELDFNGQAIEGLGTLSYAAQRGLYLHPTYAVSAQREPLGVLDAWMWVRGDATLSRSLAGLKESRRWVEGYERVAEQAASLPDTRLVYMADREGDCIEVMARAQALGTPADWLIRSAQNRRLAGQEGKLWDGFEKAQVLGDIRFVLPARQGQAARAVTQQVSVRRCTLRSPDGKPIEVSALLARETNAPAGVKPLQWRLLTNRRTDTLEEAAELVDWYRCRWEIEIFFDILKNGCGDFQASCRLSVAIMLLV